MADVSFKLNNSGVMQVSKSAGMRDALGDCAARMAAAANSDAMQHKEYLHEKRFKKVPYASAVKTLGGTCIGVVHAKTTVGTLMNREFKSLSRQNH